MSAHSATDKWKQCTQQALTGKSERIAAQTAAGKLTARQRLELLLDHDSFCETDQLVVSPILQTKEPTDGVVTGFGTINGRKVAIYAQDFTIKGGSLGMAHAQKICKIMDMAASIGCPIIGLIDSGGARIDEGIHGLSGYGAIFARNSKYSGIIPQISAILGPCAGGAVYSPALTDFIFMTEQISQMFITGPQVIEQVTGEIITKEALGGAQAHTQRSGVAHVVSATEQECFEQVKQLLSYLPDNYKMHPPALPYDDTSPSRFENIVPENVMQGYDMNRLIGQLVDSDSFFQIQPNFASNIIVGFGHIQGYSVGIVANQPSCKAGTIDIDASVKAARFIRFCDSFGIPIVSLVDVPGFLCGVEQEHGGIIRHGAKLLYAYATATVPKITVIIRKAFGGAFIVMGSKQLGADFNFAWPTAQIAVLGPQAAVSILNRRKLAQAVELGKEATSQLRAELEAEYSQQYLNPLVAAQHGYIDGIIEPSQTRNQIAKALEITRSKVQALPARRHGNIPL
ncbi:MAG: acyl-CoA carboxylase subunit beta [Epsilonproteobacteria bacterium]|nr:acyl-CoA carboxylase subunit beta [Campylobacterota bacterium]